MGQAEWGGQEEWGGGGGQAELGAQQSRYSRSVSAVSPGGGGAIDGWVTGWYNPNGTLCFRWFILPASLIHALVASFWGGAPPPEAKPLATSTLHDCP